MMKVEVYLPICWELYNNQGTIIRQVCSSNPAYCSKRFAVCVDSEGNVTYYPVAPMIQIVGGPVSCIKQHVEEPLPGQISDCYRADTDCNSLIP